MENHENFNASIMSSASAISLESTMTEEFQGLKAFQAEVANQVDRVVDYYGRVKGIVIDESQNGSGQRLIKLETFNEERHAAVEMLSSYYLKTAEAVPQRRREVEKTREENPSICQHDEGEIISNQGNGGRR